MDLGGLQPVLPMDGVLVPVVLPARIALVRGDRPNGALVVLASTHEPEDQSDENDAPRCDRGVVERVAANEDCLVSFFALYVGPPK